MTHIDPDSEFSVLEKYGRPTDYKNAHSPLTRDEILSIRTHIHERVVLDDSIKRSLVEIANASRAHPDIMLGLSTRTLVQSIAALKAHALLQARDYVSPEDINALALPLFKHRLLIKGGEERRNAIVSEIITQPLDALIRNRLKG